MTPSPSPSVRLRSLSSGASPTTSSIGSTPRRNSYPVVKPPEVQSSKGKLFFRSESGTGDSPRAGLELQPSVSPIDPQLTSGSTPMMKVASVPTPTVVDPQLAALHAMTADLQRLIKSDRSDKIDASIAFLYDDLGYDRSTSPSSTRTGPTPDAPQKASTLTKPKLIQPGKIPSGKPRKKPSVTSHLQHRPTKPKASPPVPGSLTRGISESGGSSKPDETRSEAQRTIKAPVTEVKSLVAALLALTANLEQWLSSNPAASFEDVLARLAQEPAFIKSTFARWKRKGYDHKAEVLAAFKLHMGVLARVAKQTLNHPSTKSLPWSGAYLRKWQLSNATLSIANAWASCTHQHWMVHIPEARTWDQAGQMQFCESVTAMEKAQTDLFQHLTRQILADD